MILEILIVGISLNFMGCGGDEASAKMIKKKSFKCDCQNFWKYNGTNYFKCDKRNPNNNRCVIYAEKETETKGCGFKAEKIGNKLWKNVIWKRKEMKRVK